MILYVNGDSHTAAAEAVNPFSFAEDDKLHWALKRRPHPDNLAVSWGVTVASILKMGFQIDAESASSNARIIRTTKEWIEKTADTIPTSDVLMIIQWSTWEREEWLIDGEYFQVNASGVDDVPEDFKEKYKEYIVNIDWDIKTAEAYEEIQHFHTYLNKLGYKHIFFNGNNSFQDIPEEYRSDFGASYINPYLPEGAFDGWLQLNGYNTVITSNYHYGPAAHSAWAKQIIQYIIEHKVIK
jgi:hypothetical protein